MKFQNYPLSEVYRLIEPGPVVMVTTSHRGQDNIMSMSWHTMLEFTPALIGCVLSNRNFSFELLKKSRECVIAIPTVELAATVVKIGNVSGKKLDKFKRFGLTKQPASKVKAPLVAECYANLECRIFDSALIGKYNFFVLQVVKTWVDPKLKNPKFLHHFGSGRFSTDGKKMKLPWKLK